MRVYSVARQVYFGAWSRCVGKGVMDREIADRGILVVWRQNSKSKYYSIVKTMI